MDILGFDCHICVQIAAIVSLGPTAGSSKNGVRVIYVSTLPNIGFHSSGGRGQPLSGSSCKKNSASDPHEAFRPLVP